MGRSCDRREFLARGRRVLGGAAAGAIGGTLAYGAGPARPKGLQLGDDPATFVFPRVKFVTLSRERTQWDVNPRGDRNFLEYLGKATNIKLSRRSWQERVISIDDHEKIYTLPFLFMTGEGLFRFSQRQVLALREFFARGGFLHADECVGPPEMNEFYLSFVREARKIIPGGRMAPVPPTHEIYRCFYNIPRGSSPRSNAFLSDPDMGLFVDGRMVAFLTVGDLHCGWWGGNGSNSAFDRAHKRHQLPSFHMGTNIVVYALTH